MLLAPLSAPFLASSFSSRCKAKLSAKAKREDAHTYFEAAAAAAVWMRKGKERKGNKQLAHANCSSAALRWYLVRRCCGRHGSCISCCCSRFWLCLSGLGASRSSSSSNNKGSHFVCARPSSGRAVNLAGELSGPASQPATHSLDQSVCEAQIRPQ